MEFGKFLRINGDLTAFTGILTGLTLPLIGIAAYESRRYADLYSQHRHPALMERSEMYAFIAPAMAAIYLMAMAPVVYEAVRRWKSNKSL